MRKFNTLAIVMVSAVFSMWMLSGCGGNKSKVNTFEVAQSIKTLQSAYVATGKDAVFADSLPIYSMVDLCITWPEKLGNQSIGVLKDSLLMAIFGSCDKDIDDAMIALSKKPLGSDQFKMEELDSVPSSSAMLYTYNVDVTLTEISHTLLVYDITKYTYQGGAHGMTITSFLNYDIESEQVLTFDTIFKPGSEQQLLDAIRQELYTEYNAQNDKQLEEAGIFVDQIYVTRNFYINDYKVVFFYNQYEIAPYAFGSIIVEVPYFKIENCLTPEALGIFKVQ